MVFWEYWTAKRQVDTYRRVEHWPVSGDGHSFRDSYEEEIIEIPIYASRLGTLTRRIILFGVLASIGFGFYHKHQKEERIKENSSMIYKINKIAERGDYNLSDEKGRALINEFGLTHPGKGREHLLRFEPTENGAKWCFASTHWNRDYLGEISSERLKEYLDKHSER